MIQIGLSKIDPAQSTRRKPVFTGFLHVFSDQMILAPAMKPTSTSCSPERAKPPEPQHPADFASAFLPLKPSAVERAERHDPAAPCHRLGSEENERPTTARDETSVPPCSGHPQPGPPEEPICSRPATQPAPLRPKPRRRQPSFVRQLRRNAPLQGMTPEGKLRSSRSPG